MFDCYAVFVFTWNQSNNLERRKFCSLFWIYLIFVTSTTFKSWRHRYIWLIRVFFFYLNWCLKPFQKNLLHPRLLFIYFFIISFKQFIFFINHYIRNNTNKYFNRISDANYKEKMSEILLSRRNSYFLRYLQSKVKRRGIFHLLFSPCQALNHSYAYFS